MYDRRFYRDWVLRDDLKRFEVKIGQSDLLILADRDLKDLAFSALERVRRAIEGHIAGDPEFQTTLRPHEVPEDAPEVVRAMARAARHWDVGPMAAVAGAVAQAVGVELAARTETAIIENGGDVYARTVEPLRLALYAGESSPFSDRVRFEVNAKDGIGVCTSSGTVGPSLSFGNADAVVAVADDAAFADAAATSIANRIKSPDDVDEVVAEQEERGDLKGLIACCKDRLGLWGEIELVRT